MFVILFNFPEGDALYAGRVAKDNSLGWAPTVKTAIEFETREQAENMLKNGYGRLAEHGEIVELP